MKNVNYVTNETLVSIIKDLKADDIVIADNEVIVELANKYNKACKNVSYYTRKTLHSEIENQKPSIVILMFNSEKTIAFINSILPNAVRF